MDMAVTHLKRCSITRGDVIAAEDIFGPNLGALKREDHVMTRATRTDWDRSSSTRNFEDTPLHCAGNRHNVCQLRRLPSNHISQPEIRNSRDSRKQTSHNHSQKAQND